MTKYEALAHYLRESCITGKPPRTALPSVATLMATRRVSQATVDRALGLLEAEGLIIRQAGVGCFTVGAAPAEDALTREIADAGRVDLPTVRVAVCSMPGEGNPMWEELLGAFRRTRPGCLAQGVYFDPLREGWQTVLKDETPLDVLYCPPSGIEAGVADGLFAELSGYRQDWRVVARQAMPHLPEAWRRQVVPYSYTARVVLYVSHRMDVLGTDFSKGWTWRDFAALCQRLRSLAPVAQPVLLLDNYESFCQLWAGSIVDAGSGQVRFDGPEARAAVEALRFLYQELHAFPLCSRLELSRIVDVLRGPQAAICIGRTPWRTRLERMGVPPLGMWPLPVIGRGQPAAMVNYLGVYRYSRYPHLAWELIDFICRPAAQTIIGRHRQEFPLYATEGTRPLSPLRFGRGAPRPRTIRLAPEPSLIPADILQSFTTTIFNREIEACLTGVTGVDECVQRISRLGTSLIRNSVEHRRRCKQSRRMADGLTADGEASA